MKRMFLLLLTCGVFSVITHHSSQISLLRESFGQTQFQRTIGGTDYDWGFSIIQTRDGGYAAAGYTLSFGAGGGDFYIAKLNADGILQWTRTIGGTGVDAAFQIIQTTDGGYAVAGATNSFGEFWDFYIVKLDSSGTLQWNRTVGGIEFDGGGPIIQTTDGGYVVGGGTESFGLGSPHDFFIIKLDANGVLQWSRTVGGTDYDGLQSIIQTADGGYAAAGITLSFGAGSWDMYIVKIDSSGTLQWNRTVGGTREEWAYSIIQSTDGGYIAAGFTYSFGSWNCNNCNDMYIVKLDSGGTLQWTRNVGGPGADFAHSITQTTDGGYAAAGGCLSFGGPHWYFVKLSSAGTLQWSRDVRGTNGEYAWDITQTTDGGYAAVGATNLFGAGRKDISIVKLDAGGNTCYSSNTPSSQSGTGGTVTSPSPTVTSPTPTVTSPTPAVGTGGTLTTVCVIGIQPISNEVPASYQLEQNYPNPFNPLTRIRFAVPSAETRLIASLRIYDVLGREVAVPVNEPLNPGIYEVEWDGTNYPSGIYFYSMKAGGFSETKRMVLIK